MSRKVCIFAVAFESESCKQEKHCDTVPDLKSAKLQQEDEHYMLSLDVYAWYAGTLPVDGSIPSGVRNVPQYPVPAKVFADT